MIVAKYKFNPSTYENYLPMFNNGYTDYTTSDVSNSDGTIIRTIESSSLPTQMRFGETTSASDRSNSLLEILDMNTSNLNSMANMFARCTNLTSIMCNWDTSKVTSIQSMFCNCQKLTSLDVSNWDTSQVVNMYATFQNCSSLTSLDIGNWDINKVVTLQSTFEKCSSLTSLDLNNWDTSNVDNMYSTFYLCSSLTSLDIGNWDTNKVVRMNITFSYCSSLTSLDVSNWNTSRVTNMDSMFNYCSSLTLLDVSNWNTSNVTNMANMFRYCEKLTSLDLNSWDTSNVTNMGNIFYNCPSLRKIKMINATIPQLTDILPTRASSSLGYLFSPIPIPNEKNWNTILTYTGYNITIKTSLPLGKNDKLYWSSSNNRFEIDRNGVIEVPTVEGDIVDLPRLYQKDFSTINISTDNIEPSKIVIEYNDINNN